MDKETKFDFAREYVRFLAEVQDCVDELYANLIYGGYVYEDTRIDLYEFFDRIPDRDGMCKLQDVNVRFLSNNNVQFLSSGRIAVSV